VDVLDAGQAADRRAADASHPNWMPRS
jgi:hypothetical protein